MQIIKKDNVEQAKATLNQTDFVRSPFNSEDITIHNIWTKSMGGFSFYKWIIIGSAAVIGLLLGSIFLYKLCTKMSHSRNDTSIKVENNFSNNIPTCPLPTTAHTGTNPMDSRPPSYVDTKLLEIEQAYHAKQKWLEQKLQSK